MKKSKKLYWRFINFISQLTQPFFNPVELLYSFPRYGGFVRDWLRYSRMKGREAIGLLDVYPCIHDKTKTTGFDRHYFYQDIWAFRRICGNKVSRHIDVGSRVDFIGFLSSITKVIFIDIRPIETNLKNLESVKGDILSLPFKDNSVSSFSCLHVAEHIGLGRYGDSLDPLGTKKACQELARVLAKDGNLYFSVPVGKPRLCFNAHRIHSSEQILQYFDGLKLVEFSAVDDDGVFRENIDIGVLKDENYACGLFWFKKPSQK